MVDNGSDDPPTADDVLALGADRFVQTGSNLGYAGGNNMGIQFALEEEADFAWILNNDTVAQRGAMSELVAAAGGSSRTGVLTSNVATRDGTLERDAALRGSSRDAPLDFFGDAHVVECPGCAVEFHAGTAVRGPSLFFRVSALRVATRAGAHPRRNCRGRRARRARRCPRQWLGELVGSPPSHRPRFSVALNWRGRASGATALVEGLGVASRFMKVAFDDARAARLRREHASLEAMGGSRLVPGVSVPIPISLDARESILVLVESVASRQGRGPARSKRSSKRLASWVGPGTDRLPPQLTPRRIGSET